VEEAIAYIERTGVDFLAVSIDTVHGRTKAKPRLDFSRLAHIHEKVKIPLVIHGITGLPDPQCHKLVDHGVAKINCYTELAEIAVDQTQHNLGQEEITYPQLFSGVRTKLAAEVQRCMQVWGNAGRAAEVLMQCRTWHNVEHVIVYNPASTDRQVIDDMLIRGKQQLSKIPGVLKVQIGKALNSQAKYRNCWLIRFAHKRVIESYKSHPLHVAYADKYFRPVATDRITNDNEILDAMETNRQFPQPATPQTLDVC
jgi:fructose-bisphosphate aldolase class II